MRQALFVRGSALESASIQLMSKWVACTKCAIGCQAGNHVMWEFMPLDSTPLWMVIGEGPGMSEDTVARPFIGESGKLLRRAIFNASGDVLMPPLCITNLICCRPYLTLPTTTGNRAPSPDEIDNCEPRLRALIEIVQPKLIVALGNVPHDYLGAMNLSSELRHIRHPAYILRRGIAEYEHYVLDLKRIIDYIRITWQQ